MIKLLPSIFVQSLLFYDYAFLTHLSTLDMEPIGVVLGCDRRTLVASFGMCIDNRHLDEENKFPIHRIDDLLDKI